MTKARDIADLLDASSDVKSAALDNVSVTPTAVSDQDNTSTGQFVLPEGTTAQRPVTAYSGAQRYNTDLGVMEYYNGSEWLKIAAEQVSLSSITGNIYAGVAGSDLTLTGTGFLTDTLTVNFTQLSDSIDEDVNVTATSDTAATVTVPSAVYSNVTAGNVVTITVTNIDNTTASLNKTALALPSGGTITTSGNYRIHTFTSSGTFTNTIASLDVQYLVIAGGAGGGGDSVGGGGGGGGAGGYRTNVSGQTSGRNSSAESALSLSTGNKTVTVGSGGAARANGGNSVFDSITSIGGGTGGVQSGAGASNGGSGGGTGRDQLIGSRGFGTAGQGYDGGYGDATSWRSGGGGGGAGQDGGNGSNDQIEMPNTSSSYGGDGLSSNITGSSVTRAGGGAGAWYTGSNNTIPQGGAGGGGNGGKSQKQLNATNGTVNTGSGGGGGDERSGNVALTGAGGSGIVIVRYDITAI